jgi:hypothetical protein
LSFFEKEMFSVIRSIRFWLALMSTSLLLVDASPLNNQLSGKVTTTAGLQNSFSLRQQQDTTGTRHSCVER